jgi:mRNA-degrading endonuclease RelE of RelBE toxin-antitoxin system
MRNSSDICLLCRDLNATQKNSHIFPRFLGNSLLNNKNFKRVYTIAESLSKPKYSQDIPKQNYLFCPNCESLLATKFETPLANNFFRYIDSKTEYFNITFKGYYKYRVYYKSDYVLLKKFLYSILFRASIADLIEFRGFNIGEKYENNIRKMLLDDTYFEDYPLYLFTCKENDPRENQILAERVVGETFNLHANEYVIIFDLSDSKEFMFGFQEICMYKDFVIRICQIEKSSWRNWMNKSFEIMEIRKENKSACI